MLFDPLPEYNEDTSNLEYVMGESDDMTGYGQSYPYRKHMTDEELLKEEIMKKLGHVYTINRIQKALDEIRQGAVSEDNRKRISEFLNSTRYHSRFDKRTFDSEEKSDGPELSNYCIIINNIV